MDNQTQEIATDHVVVDESSQLAVLQANVANLNTLEASEEQPHTPMSTENSTAAAAVPPQAPKKAKKSNVGKGKPLKRQKLQFDDEEESEGENSRSTSLGKNINKNTFAYFIRLITKQTWERKNNLFFIFLFLEKLLKCARDNEQQPLLSKIRWEGTFKPMGVVKINQDE